ncbi:C40 family peptidase [Aliiroseovarius sp.]|uniref:C40 family peptidase n=1 Tax=Aliiroseovarius sp. TaxID=1872442 RepID=UPI0026288713|nr:C40 family peptidase [Aliiroseovarius sp.]
MDRRLTPANGRVAFEGMEAPPPGLRLVRGDTMRVAHPVADLCADPNGARDKQMLLGQAFTVLEVHDGWAFGFDPVDGYAGYLPEGAVVAGGAATHRVTARQSHIYLRPDLKSRETACLSFFCELDVTGEVGGFAELAGGGFVPFQHIAPLSHVAGDAVSVAESFLGTPYLWGGNSGSGIDCSGLVQLALRAAGRACPRDSDMQEGLGREMDGTLQRGDLLFWKGHVAMVVDADRIIHANAHHMAVAYEGIEEAISRIETQGDGPVTARRRL